MLKLFYHDLYLCAFISLPPYHAPESSDGSMTTHTYNALRRTVVRMVAVRERTHGVAHVRPTWSAVNAVVQLNGNEYQYDRRNRPIRAELEGVFGVDALSLVSNTFLTIDVQDEIFIRSLEECHDLTTTSTN